MRSIIATNESRGNYETVRAWHVGFGHQYFGLAQRRKRVFVVASARKDFHPDKVLFEFDGVRRDTPPSRSERQEAARSVTQGFAESSFAQFRPTNGDCGTLKRSGGVLGGGSETFVIDQPVYANGGEICNTVTSKWAKGSSVPAGSETSNLVIHGTQDPIIQDNQAFPLGRNSTQDKHAVAYGIQGNMIGRNDNAGPQGSGVSEDVSFTLTKGDRHGVAVADIAGTLTLGFGARGVDADQIANGNCAINHGLVRRLTPIECERLQGFPDEYTKIPYRNKAAEECPDGARYAALGNSMAVTVMHWIGQRIQAHLNGELC